MAAKSRRRSAPNKEAKKSQQARKNQEAAKSRRARTRRPSLVLVVAAVLLAAGAGYFYLSEDPSVEAALDYAPEDIVYQRPIHAVHEMGEGPPARFLPADGPQPRLVMPEIFYDFGRVGPTAVVKRGFVIGNTGDAPLTISRAFTTCGCTTAEFSASVIPPGKVALVTLVFDAGFHDVRGKTVRRGLVIESNDRNNPKAEIWVRALVANS